MPVRSYIAIFLVFVLHVSALVAAPFEPWKTSADPMAKLWEKVQKGEVKLDLRGEKEFLVSLLKALDIPVESQVLVFSKTSHQNGLISPKTPRAIYFSEEVYVGWVQGGLVEVIGIDPVSGAQFYTLSYPDQKNDKPVLSVDITCLSCHESGRTDGVPGMLVRSVYPSASGLPILRHGTFATGHDSPLSERWGGWYVTGQHGSERHMGNVIATEIGDSVTLDREAGANLESLNGFFDVEKYPVQSSDIVALMVLEHQYATQNKLTHAAKAVGDALKRQRDIQKSLGEPITMEPRGSALGLIRDLSGKIVDQLLFKDEYALENGGVQGNPAFETSFQRNRKTSAEGRSLKDFQLNRRLFKYRCSYMIYCKTFQSLPEPLKKEIAIQLWSALEETSLSQPQLSSSEKERIMQILVETSSEFGTFAMKRS